MRLANPLVAARLRLEVHGAVQGVGFRPFVFRLARALELSGWVRNDAAGVVLEVEGPREALETFRARLEAERPAHALLQAIAASWLPPAGLAGFEILRSDGTGAPSALVLPDLATCPACLAEVLDPADRRRAYPFTNCTHCGPRFTILEALPYDRPNTTMKGFTLCPACRAEYEDPGDRRFHAQPNACPTCGPRLALVSAEGGPLAEGEAALAAVARALAAGGIAAVKGIGGFHLVVDARDAVAVARLRARKARPTKPLALMVRDLAMARALCEVDEVAARALQGPEAPILLLPRRAGAGVAEGVAPGRRTLGVMLPATPLHHLLARACGFPLVATSGNLTDEPICTDDAEARVRLGGVAELFLGHDRPIRRHVDDSVGWVVEGRARLLRRARGFAPLPLAAPAELPAILGVGAQLKSAVALGLGAQVIASQHLGDLETPAACAAFETAIADLLALWRARPVAIAHDLHPDYASTRWARTAALPGGGAAPRRIAVQHHHAHLAACLAEHGAPGPALGVVWDGTGLGEDGAIWGGEFLLGDAAACTRVAHLRPFGLPGGEAAVREPRRAALALLWELEGEAALEAPELAALFAPAERRVLGRMLARGLNAPRTTSMGRLFDGVAALLGLGARASFEGEVAMALEDAAEDGSHGAWPIAIATATAPAGALVLDWGLMLPALREDLRRGVAKGVMAARFHAGLVSAACYVAARVGAERVALTGGCFQNRRLLESLAPALRRAGHEVLLHAQVPPNDGGIAVGQVMVAAARLAAEGGEG